jgi:hypothetical protein
VSTAGPRPGRHPAGAADTRLLRRSARPGVRTATGSVVRADIAAAESTALLGVPLRPDSDGVCVSAADIAVRTPGHSSGSSADTGHCAAVRPSAAGHGRSLRRTPPWRSPATPALRQEPPSERRLRQARPTEQLVCGNSSSRAGRVGGQSGRPGADTDGFPAVCRSTQRTLDHCGSGFPSDSGQSGWRSASPADGHGRGPSNPGRRVMAPGHSCCRRGSRYRASTSSGYRMTVEGTRL